jgi:hypothetical protein
LTYETEKRQQKAKGKGDSDEADRRESAPKQADGVAACCLGTLDQLSEKETIMKYRLLGNSGLRVSEAVWAP